MTETAVMGALRTADGKGIVRMEDSYDTGIEDLWSALTEPARLARWIGDVHGDLRVGGAIQVTLTSSYEGPGLVDVCHPPDHLVVRLDPGTTDQTVVEASLAADGARTRLVIEERGLPVDGLAAYGAGWQAHVEDLAAFLAGRVPADWRTRWAELRPAYDRLESALSASS